MQSKTGFYIPGAALLLGGAIGAAVAKRNGRSISDGILLGGSYGLSGGVGINNIATVIRYLRFRKAVNARKKGISDKDLKRLVKEYRGVDIPIYRQTGGAPLDNAFYYEGDPKDMTDVWFGKDRTFADALTNKPVSDMADKAVYLGDRFDKLPVVAHELGHAADFKDKSKAERWAASAAQIASWLGMAGTWAVTADCMGPGPTSRRSWRVSA